MTPSHNRGCLQLQSHLGNTWEIFSWHKPVAKAPSSQLHRFDQPSQTDVKSEVRARQGYILVLLNTSSSIQQFLAQGISSDACTVRSLHEKMGLRTAHLQCPCSTEVSFHQHHKQGISWTMKWSTCSQAAIRTNILCMKLTKIFLSKRMVSTEDPLRMEAKEGEINLG